MLGNLLIRVLAAALAQDYAPRAFHRLRQAFGIDNRCRRSSETLCLYSGSCRRNLEAVCFACLAKPTTVWLVSKVRSGIPPTAAC